MFGDLNGQIRNTQGLADKVARKILLRNFSGSSAFKSGPKAKEVE